MIPDSFPGLAGAVFGLLIGSFLNVCIHRLPSHESVVRPRSSCPSCGRLIAAYDNIPLLSYLILRGRCRHCRASISPRYPVVEAATAVLFAVVVMRYGLSVECAKWLVFMALMVVLFWTDVEQRILPDVLTLGGLGTALLLAPFTPGYSVWLASLAPSWPAGLRLLTIAVCGALLLSLPFLLFTLSYSAIRKIDALGWGDVKLLAMTGAFLGLERGLVATAIACCFGALIGLGYILITGNKISTYKLPFGAFLCCGNVAAYFWGPKLFTIWWTGGA